MKTTLSRRRFTAFAGAEALWGPRLQASAASSQRVGIVLAPSNLGLRPEGRRDPGTWRAPQVLMAAGLEAAVRAEG